MSIDFKKEVLNHKEDLLKDLFELLSVRSILGTDITEETPFGSGPREALDLILSFGKRDGYKTKLVENKAGHIEVGQGEELFGILGHVDVVPVVEADWTSHPFKPEIRDGKIFARGSLDDKGPTMAAYYAVKLLDKLGVKWNKRVRVIIGSDEETGFRCVEAYFKHEEQPASGFTPDAMFPLVYAEKARATFDHKLKFVDEDGQYNYKLVKFNGGQVLNMVIASAKAELVGEVSDIKEKFENFLAQEKLEGEVTVEDTIKLALKGKAAHGSTPQYGINGATKLAEFLSTLGLDNNGKNFVDYIVDKLANDPFGEKLGIDNVLAVHYNLSPAELTEKALANGEGKLNNTGALVIETGKYTGRAPDDKFFVDTPSVHNHIDWSRNKPIESEKFDAILGKLIAYLQKKEIYVFDGKAGANPQYTRRFRFINEMPSQNLFIHQLLIRTDEEYNENNKIDFTVISAPNFHCVPEIDGVNSEAAIIKKIYTSSSSKAS